MLGLFEFDNGFRNRGYKVLAGVDEAGRGPLAGPVVTACVVLEEGSFIDGLNDSKKISPAQRNVLFGLINKAAVEIQVEVIDCASIDTLNILNATMLGMKKSIESTKTKVSAFLIDGNKIPSTQHSCIPLIAGDSKSACIAAASIIAKVTRDRIMDSLAVKYPSYQFEKHKGYGTKAHVDLLKKHGPCEIHRKSFEPIKSMISGAREAATV